MKIPDHLLPTRFQRADIERTVRCVIVKPGTTPEMVLDPDFWVHGSQQIEGRGGGSVLKVNDRIEVIAQDGTFHLDLWVVAIDARGFWAQTRLLRAWPREIEDQVSAAVEKREKPKGPNLWPDAEGYRVEWAGPAHRFRVVDRVGSIVSKGHVTEAEAIEALAFFKSEKAAA